MYSCRLGASWQPERLPGGGSYSGYRAAHRCEIRVCSSSARRHLQGDRQHVPFDSLRGIKNKPEYQALETQRFIRRHNVTKFHQNPFFPINILMLMRGVVAAHFEGVFEPYFRAAYHHMWEEPKNLNDPEIFQKAFVSSGIDIGRLMARAQQDDVKKGLIDRTTDAVNRGAFGSPTFFVGTEMFFGKDQLRDVEESIVEQTSQLVSKTA